MTLRLYRFCIEDRYGGWTDQSGYRYVIAYSEETARISLRKVCRKEHWKIRYVDDRGSVYNGMMI